VIRRTLVHDPLRGEQGREIDTIPFGAGMTLADALPVACFEPGIPLDRLAISHNGGIVLRPDWATVQLGPGDHVGGQILPGDPGTLIITAITVVISAWQIYDATRRAKIQGHHAARRAASRAKQMQDSPTYGFGGIVNVVNPGGPIQVLVGRHKVGGQVIMGEPQGGTIGMKIGISEGRCHGYESGSAEINGKPISKYPNVNILSAPGIDAGTSFGNLFSIGGSLVMQAGLTSGIPPLGTGVNSLVTGGQNAGAYWWGNGTFWSGTGAIIGNGVTNPLSQTKPTGNTSGAVTGDIDAFATSIAINSGASVFNRAVNGTALLSFDVEHRTPQGGGAFTSTGTMTLGPFRVIGGASPGVIISNIFKSGLLALAPYDVRVTLNVGNSTLVADDGAAVTPHNNLALSLQPLLEFRQFDRTNPGLAVLGVQGIPSAAVGGVLPNVTSIWEGVQVANITAVGPPGTFGTPTYTSATIAGYTQGQNPALVILHILRNLRFGVGGQLDENDDIDLQTFVDSRDFCDELVPRGLGIQTTDAPFGAVIESGSGDGDVSAADQFDTTQVGVDFTETVKIDDVIRLTSGLNQATYRVGSVIDANSLRLTTATAPFQTVTLTIESGIDWEIQATERRSIIDYYFDGVTNVWDAVSAIARTARLAVVWTSGKIQLVADDDRGGVIAQRFHMGNLEKFTMQITGEQTSNRVEIQFLDAAKNWEQALAEFEDPDQLASRLQIVRTGLEAYGITRRSQALRLAKYHWISNRLERVVIEFECDATALTLVWGDVLEVLHDAVDTGAGRTLPSGRIRDVQGTTLIFDDWHTFPSSEGQRLIIQRSDTDASHVIPIPGGQQDLKTDRFTGLTFGAYTPVPGDLFHQQLAVIDSPLPNLYKVVSITLTEDHRRKIRAVKHNPTMFNFDSLSAGDWIENAPLAESEPG
jgi:hypothetical protein